MNNNNKEAQVGSANGGRRRFIKGAASAPVILTAISRPAMGGNFCTPSGFLSGNLSNHQDIPCNGRGPNFWKYRFPTQFQTTTFSQVFGGVWQDQSGVPWDVSTTLEKVLHFTSDEDQYRFGHHAVACYFNAIHRDQLGYPMKVGDVVELVQQILMFGLFQDPATGLSMDVFETIDFMKGTYF